MAYPTECIQTLKGHKGPVNVIRYNVHGQYCVSGGRDRSVRLWNPKTGNHLYSYEGHGREVLGVSVSRDNAKLASCSADKAVILWDVSTGQLQRKFTDHWERVNAVDFNDDNSLLISGSFDSTLRIWDLRSSNFHAIQVIEDAKDSIMSLQVRGTEIICGCNDGKLRTYDLRAGQLFEDQLGAPVTSTRMSNDTNCILVNTLNSTIRLMDKANGQQLAEFKGHKHETYKVDSALSFDDAQCISGSEDGQIYIWNVADGLLLKTLASHRGVISSVDAHPTDLGLVSGGDDGLVRVWQ
ncbi:WD40 repeat-like protein [Hesseltinella vesiculosa]|uniref:WD40 repeat-like protein n=1 Tax=Hesseltinella vesiculosa TaxID=101127 RepID=A0A1X2GFI1_9FUNG|nr:WD40 repeat-like protein [Hesseltinella vesiculosa]